jgi:hypothetical protein
MKQVGHLLLPLETPHIDPSDEVAEAIARKMARLAMSRAVRVRERNGRPPYICLLDIPPPFQDEFRTALRGSACPVIDGGGEYAWASDWADWLEGRLPRG